MYVVVPNLLTRLNILNFKNYFVYRFSDCVTIEQTELQGRYTVANR